MSRDARLYTEMVVATALLRGDSARFLAHDTAEQPVVLQLGGSVPYELAAAARLGEDDGFAEINLNVGCPSERVQSGRFGACLIAEPELVAECVSAMRATVKIPVTVKTRLGVDDCDSQEHLCHLVERVAAAGCETVIVHARKALLNFSPRANREIPPLDYSRVYALKQSLPHLNIVLNGGVHSLAECSQHLAKVDGVMLGRTAYANFDVLTMADRELFGSTAPLMTPLQILERYRPYMEQELSRGTPLRDLTKHWNGLCHGRAGARDWRRWLTTHSVRTTFTLDQVLNEARELLSVRALESAA